ncbi:MAG TPA: aminodeoxychorismate lyase [Steroidobacteraceae bacterium]|nr:aminodeoxychorismate lyase [Steroidobacteraceae bacterium]
MIVWINGRRRSSLDHRDRGLNYGDGLFETMRVLGRRIRLLDYHLDRLYAGCRALRLAAPQAAGLRRELERIASGRNDAILKLIVTRGSGVRGYRPTGRERTRRILQLYALPAGNALRAATPARVRLCATPLSVNARLAGLKTLNRLDSVLARAEWRDARIWEGLMGDGDGGWVCGTMSNLFLVHGRRLATPPLDRCGVAGVMRRWILANAAYLHLRPVERRIRWQDLAAADEVFMSNAVVGIRSVRTIESSAGGILRFSSQETAGRLRTLLDVQ